MGRDETSLEVMYGEEDLSQHPMFQGGFINFGYWKGLKKPWDQQKRARSSAQLYDLAFDALQLQPSDSILEVGCGRGLGLKALYERLPQASLVGVDGSSAQVDRCRASAVPADVLFARAERLPFINQSFDKIVSIEALQHFLAPEQFLKEAARVLRPGGRIAVATFFLLGEAGRPELEKLIPTVRQKIDRVMPVEDFEAALEAAGFAVDQRLAIGEEVWEPLDQWLEMAFPTEWGRNWVVAYREKLLDYFLLTARKETSGTG
jgi:MPBQ/MSBQ methyltransferase